MSSLISNQFIESIKAVVSDAQNKAIRSVNQARVLMYWNIGKQIIEEEQKGEKRAEYGAFVIQTLAKELTTAFGSGFSKRQLELCRQFYQIFPIANALRSQLNWSQYKLLLRIDNEDKQICYVEECC